MPTLRGFLCFPLHPRTVRAQTTPEWESPLGVVNKLCSCIDVATAIVKGGGKAVQVCESLRPAVKLSARCVQALTCHTCSSMLRVPCFVDAAHKYPEVAKAVESLFGELPPKSTGKAADDKKALVAYMEEHVSGAISTCIECVRARAHA
jgi:hypothetical protein